MMENEYTSEKLSSHVFSESISISNVSSKNKSNGSQCDPCLELEKHEVATSICTECEERLCNSCTNQHRKRKLTKSHELKLIESLTSIAECGFCYTKVDTRTCMFCKNCEESLCPRCVQKHQHKPVFKHHTLVTHDRKSRNEISVCDPCRENEVTKTAEAFCAQCEEHLCDICTRYHRAQKATKLHKLIDISSKTLSHDPYCEPCNEDGKTIKATRVCSQCEERLCEECAEEHTSMKMMKDHHIDDISEVFKPNDVWCNQCLAKSAFVKAVKYCSVCNEHFCDYCCKKHKRFKLSKAHPLQEIYEVNKHDNNVCTVCKNDKKKDTCCCELQRYADANELLKSTFRSFGNLELRKDNLAADDEGNVKDNINGQGDRPGKPKRLDDRPFGGVSLTWEPPFHFRDGDFYQVSYKELENDRKWKLYDGKFQEATAELNDLQSNAVFIFRVRVLSEDREGPYSEESNEIRTPLTAACQVLQTATILNENNFYQPVYALPMKEVMRHERLKINKLVFGLTEATETTSRDSKTILLVGETGSGKSTLIDLIVNYVLGVNWNDPFRFKVTDLNKESKEIDRCSASLTDWITCYTINMTEGGRICYQLNIIDTPGFGNTRGHTRDQEIIDQLREILSNNQPYGLGLIDAVCFVIKANESRLTSFQTYIFRTLLSLFGKDIEKHICSFITFADSTELDCPVMDTLKEYKFPLVQTFSFNNVSLFCKTSRDRSIKSLFWQMGITSLHSFFYRIEQLESKSLHMTKMVLRHQLSIRETTKILLCQITVLIEIKRRLEDTRKLLNKEKSAVGDGQNFDTENNDSININNNLERMTKTDIEELEHEMKSKSEDIDKSISILQTCQERLKEKALSCWHVSFTQNIETLIQNDEIEKSEEYLEGIKLLKEIGRKAGLT